MTRAGGTAELHVLLREALQARLAEAGWVPDDGQRTDPDAYDVAALRRPVADDFAATASFSRAQSLSERPPLWVTGVEVGVSYEPLQRLWPLLVERPPSGELATDVEELLASPRELAVKVFRAADVAAAADDLAAPVLEHAVAYARRYASVDALVAAHLADEDVDAEDEEDRLGVSRAVPALLAAAGRFDEARAALAGYAPERPDDHRFVRQLTRWLDAGGELSLPPRAVPSARPSERRSPRLGPKARCSGRRPTSRQDSRDPCSARRSRQSSRGARCRPRPGRGRYKPREPSRRSAPGNWAGQNGSGGHCSCAARVA